MLLTVLADQAGVAPVPVWQTLLQYGAVALATILAVLITQAVTSWREGRLAKTKRAEDRKDEGERREYERQQRVIEQGRDAARECLSVLSEALTDADADLSLVDWRGVSTRIRRESALIDAASVRWEMGRGAACLSGLAGTLARPGDAKALLGTLHALAAAWLREDATAQADLERDVKAVVSDFAASMHAKINAAVAPTSPTTPSSSE